MADSGDPLLIIGDVHGDADRLLGLLLLPKSADRRIVFVGDLINRGPHSRRVLDMVRELRLRRSAVVLRGNHEQALLDFVAGGSIAPLLRLGGASTILDYIGLGVGDISAQFRRAFPVEHLNLLHETVATFEHGVLVVTHDGTPDAPEPPENEGRHDAHPSTLRNLARSGKYSVFGHYRQRSGRPLILDNMACLDTGCGSGGPLTGLLWPERDYVQF